jgi:hypothetical protein
MLVILRVIEKFRNVKNKITKDYFTENKLNLFKKINNQVNKIYIRFNNF